MFNDSKDTAYTITPSKKVDEAWDQLIGGRYVRLKDTEIVNLNKSTYDHPLETLPSLDQRVEPHGVYGGVDVTFYSKIGGSIG